jgi:hypothetical protein
MEKVIYSLFILIFSTLTGNAQVKAKFKDKEYTFTKKYSHTFIDGDIFYYDVKDGFILLAKKDKYSGEYIVIEEPLNNLDGMYLMRSVIEKSKNLVLYQSGSKYPTTYYFASENERDEFYKYIIQSMTPEVQKKYEDYLSKDDMVSVATRPSNETLFYISKEGIQFSSTQAPQISANKKEKWYINFKTDTIELIEANVDNSDKILWIRVIKIADQTPIIYNDKKTNRVFLYFKQRVKETSYAISRSAEEVYTGNLQEFRIPFNTPAAAQEFIENYQLHAILLPGNFSDYTYNNESDYDRATSQAFNAERTAENKRSDKYEAMKAEKASSEGAMLTIGKAKIYKIMDKFVDSDKDELLTFAGTTYSKFAINMYSVQYSGTKVYVYKENNCIYTVSNNNVYAGKDGSIAIITKKGNEIYKNNSIIATIKEASLNSSQNNFNLADIAVLVDMQSEVEQ